MNVQATEKLQLNTSVVYNKAKDSWDWDFADRPAVDFINANGTGAPDLAVYDSTSINGSIDEYSDLSYEQYQVTVGGTYNFTPACYLTASLTYDVFKSDEEYVYGDEDGDAYYGYIGFGHRF